METKTLSREFLIRTAWCPCDVISYCSRVCVAIDYLLLMNRQSSSGRGRYTVVSAVV